MTSVHAEPVGTRAPGDGGAPPVRVLRTMGLTTMASVAVLLANTLSGVLIARLLSASGKGAVTAIASWAQLTAWVCVLGFPSAMTYLQARRPELGRSIIGTSLLATLLFGALGVVVGEVLVTVVFADQPAAIRTMAQAFVFTVFLFVLLDFVVSILAGNRSFTVLNVVRVLQPVTYVVLLGGLSVLTELTVGWVLVAALSALVVVVALGLRTLATTIGIGAPSRAILRENLGYGLKLQGGTLAGLANQRLDILVMPLVLSASSIGVYSVAVSTSSMVLALVHSLATVVFPVASHAGDKAPQFVGRSLRMTVLFAAALAAGLFVTSPLLLRWIYGEEFVGGVTALRILLVGYVCMAGSSIVVAGLKASNKPLAASASQLAAVPITLVGLWLLLERFGIEGAAAVSTVAYASALAFGLTLLARQDGYSMGALLSLPALREDLRVVLGRSRAAVRGARRSC